MLIISISPILGFIVAFVGKKYKFRKQPFFIILGLFILIEVLFSINGYSFRSNILKTTLDIVIAILSFNFLFTYLNLGNKVNLLFAIIISILFFITIILGSMAAEFGGGKREVINQVKFKNYIAYELEPKMYEGENTLRIVKIAFFELVEKKIYESPFSYISNKDSCTKMFFINQTELRYNFCNKKLDFK